MQKQNGKNNKKASISIYVAFIGLTFILIVIAALVAPIGVRFTTEIYSAGEQILLSANETIWAINDSTVRDSILTTVGEAQTTSTDNITVMSAMYKYSWIFILAIAALSAYIYSRRLVEVGGGVV